MLRAGEMAYEHFGGRTGAGRRPPLVLIHGAAGSRLFWPPALRRLAGVEVYALDLPGHGASGGDPPSTIGGYVETLRAWLAEAGVPRAIFAGHSMGSAIALTLALTDAGAVAGLILVGGGPSLRVNRKLRELSGSVTTARQAVDLMVDWSFGSGAPARLIELARRRMADTPAHVLHSDLAACDGFDVRPDLARIEPPVLALCGTEDRMTPPDQSRALVAALPRARLCLVEGAGHMVMLENAEAVVGSVETFLADSFPAA